MLTKNWRLKTFWHFSNLNYLSDSYLHCPFHYRIKCTFLNCFASLSCFRYHISICLNSCSEIEVIPNFFFVMFGGQIPASSQNQLHRKGCNWFNFSLVHPPAWPIYRWHNHVVVMSHFETKGGISIISFNRRKTHVR